MIARAGANPYEGRARSRKAIKIATALIAAGPVGGPPVPLHLLAAAADAKDREDVAKALGCTTPSDETWAEVVEILRDSGVVA